MIRERETEGEKTCLLFGGFEFCADKHGFTSQTSIAVSKNSGVSSSAAQDFGQLAGKTGWRVSGNMIRLSCRSVPHPTTKAPPLLASGREYSTHMSDTHGYTHRKHTPTTTTSCFQQPSSVKDGTPKQNTPAGSKQSKQKSQECYCGTNPPEASHNNMHLHCRLLPTASSRGEDSERGRKESVVCCCFFVDSRHAASGRQADGQLGLRKRQVLSSVCVTSVSRLPARALQATCLALSLSLSSACLPVRETERSSLHPRHNSTLHDARRAE